MFFFMTETTTTNHTLILKTLNNINLLFNIIGLTDAIVLFKALGCTPPTFTIWSKSIVPNHCAFFPVVSGLSVAELAARSFDIAEDEEIRLENKSQEEMISRHFKAYGDDAPLVLAAGGDPEL